MLFWYSQLNRLVRKIRVASLLMSNKLSSQTSGPASQTPVGTLTPRPATVEDAIWELAAVVTAIRTGSISVTDARRWRVFGSFVVAASRELEAATRIVPSPLPDLDGFLDQISKHV